jgi:predicted RNA-binding protein YlxR (DUF448 family)
MLLRKHVPQRANIVVDVQQGAGDLIRVMEPSGGSGYIES